MGSHPLDKVASVSQEDAGLGPSASGDNAADLWRYIEHLERWRQSVGYEIHDGLTQQITAALLFLEAAGREKPDPVLLDRCRSILEEALAESRRLIEGLNPKRLDEEGLEAALQEFLKQNATLSQAAVRRDIAADLPRMVTWQRSTLFRFLQEAITNARKHSDASEIDVMVRAEAGEVVAAVRDNGRGIEPGAVRIGGQGLRSLQHKAELLGGTFQVESAQETPQQNDLQQNAAPHGTTVSVRFIPKPL